jgi:hypothetical protein
MRFMQNIPLTQSTQRRKLYPDNKRLLPQIQNLQHFSVLIELLTPDLNLTNPFEKERKKEEKPRGSTSIG